MRCPFRLSILTFTVACFGLGFDCAPAARANFLPTVTNLQPVSSDLAPLAAFLGDPTGAEAAGSSAAPVSEAGDPPAKAIPESPPSDLSSLVLGDSCTRGDTGGCGSSTSSAGQGSGQNAPPAGLPLHKSFLLANEVVGFLRLEEAAHRPPAFTSRLFRPPRMG
jgi:hypothetical protein